MKRRVGSSCKLRVACSSGLPEKELLQLKQVVANPNVDAVLVLACFLAVVVFKPFVSISFSFGFAADSFTL